MSGGTGGWHTRGLVGGGWTGGAAAGSHRGLWRVWWASRRQREARGAGPACGGQRWLAVSAYSEGQRLAAAEGVR
jgi:hypothetical protein